MTHDDDDDTATRPTTIRLPVALYAELTALGASTLTDAIVATLEDGLEREGSPDALDEVAANAGVSRAAARVALAHHPLAVLALVLADGPVPAGSVSLSLRHSRVREVLAELERVGGALQVSLAEQRAREELAPQRAAEAATRARRAAAQRLLVLLAELPDAAERLRAIGTLKLAGGSYDPALERRCVEIQRLEEELRGQDVAALAAEGKPQGLQIMRRRRTNKEE